LADGKKESNGNTGPRYLTGLKTEKKNGVAEMVRGGKLKKD
jgi:hypothetical protein